MIPSGLQFAALSTDHVDCGAGVATNDVVPFTWWAWVLPVSAFALIMTKSPAGGARKDFYFDTGPVLKVGIKRATANSNTYSNTGFLTAGLPTFCVAVYDETTGVKLYIGTLNTPASEPTYSLFAAGSGATTSDAASSVFLGNNSDLEGPAAAFTGFSSGILGRVLSLGEIRQLQRSSASFRHRLRHVWGANGRGRVLDRSGNNNHGTITGAVPVSAGLPGVGRRRLA